MLLVTHVEVTDFDTNVGRVWKMLLTLY